MVYDTMVQINDAAKTRGDVPGSWARVAEEHLRPQVDWRKELGAAVKRAVSQVAGQVDYSRDKPSRRTPLSKGLIKPRLVRPIPEVAVVVDTSGSMSDAEQSQCLSEVESVIRGALNGAPVRVLAVDAAVHATKKAFSRNQVQLAGGGGTDMGVGIKAASELKPRPDTIIVLTDGYTPWPSVKPEGSAVVIGVIGADEPGRLDPSKAQTPEWARTVGIPIGDKISN